MPKAPLPANEEQRLTKLRSFNVMDTACEQAFDDITFLAAQILKVPISAISLVDRDRQYFKSQHGLDISETSRDVSFCAHALLEPHKLFVVPDATKDARFSDNALVTGDPMIRFYAGAPLVTDDGFALGALCVIDSCPHDPTPDQLLALRVLSRQVVRLLDARRHDEKINNAVASLELNQKLLNDTSRLGKIGGYEIDLQTMMPIWSEEVFRIHELEVGIQPPIEDAINFYAPVARPIITQAVQDAILHGIPYDLELPFITAKGRHRWVRAIAEPVVVNGKVMSVKGMFQDITEQHNASDLIRENKQRLEIALDASNTGLWDWNAITGKSFFTDRWYQMLGYEPLELPMSLDTWKILCHPDDLKVAMAALDDYFSGKTDVYRTEQRMKQKDGSWRWILDIGRIVEREQDGTPVRMIGVHIDIDELKRTQVEISKTSDLANSANRAKSEFLANMSHEIRTPMTAIMGFADLLLDEKQTPAEQIESIQTIKRNGEHLLSIINDVLDLSKIEADRMTVEKILVEPNNVIQDVVAMFKPRALGQGVELKNIEVGLLPISIQSDPLRLRQILVNLIGNAIKFTEAGSVEVTSEVLFEDQQPCELVIHVKDTGIGMDESQLRRLFQPFQQGDTSMARRFGGTGLGLTISARLAHLINGRLEAVSQQGKGSTFSLYLDLAGQQITLQSAPATMKPVESMQKSDITNLLFGTRILLAEDGPDNQRLIGFQLRKAGAIVEIAENGRVAFGLIVQSMTTDKPYDIVLSDMQMPEMDGYELAREVRQHGWAIPLIALTANAMSGDRERCISVGCDDYTTKPINAVELVHKILGCLRAKCNAA